MEFVKYFLIFIFSSNVVSELQLFIFMIIRSLNFFKVFGFLLGNNDKVRLNDIKSLTLKKNEYTAARRTSPILQVCWKHIYILKEILNILFCSVLLKISFNV